MNIKTSSLSVKLKSNQNIAFDVMPEFCKCGKPMFLRKNNQGDIFWSCKGYHPKDDQIRCDHTRDVKCFKCCSGEIIRKRNKLDNSAFYGCTNYSNISDSSCNFTFEEHDLDHIIEQVNEGLKFRYNFKSTYYNRSDDITWQKQNRDITCTNNQNLEQDKKDESLIKKHLLILFRRKSTDSDNKCATKKTMGLPPKLATYIATAILTVGLITSLNGMDVEISLFGDLFRINIKNATSDDVNIAIDNENETVMIENTKDKPVNISNLSLKNHAGHELIDFSLMDSNQAILEPHEKIVLHEHDLINMIEKSMNYAKSSDDRESYAANEYNPNNDDISTTEGSESIGFKIISQLWEEDNGLEFVIQTIEKGIAKYEQVTQHVINTQDITQGEEVDYLKIENLQETSELKEFEEIIKITEDTKKVNADFLKTGLFRN